LFIKKFKLFIQYFFCLFLQLLRQKTCTVLGFNGRLKEGYSLPDCYILRFFANFPKHTLKNTTDCFLVFFCSTVFVSPFFKTRNFATKDICVFMYICKINISAENFGNVTDIKNLIIWSDKAVCWQNYSFHFKSTHKQIINKSLNLYANIVIFIRLSNISITLIFYHFSFLQN